jgi:hypothetical protein
MVKVIYGNKTELALLPDQRSVGTEAKPLT